jgi:hypothetical protein
MSVSDGIKSFSIDGAYSGVLRPIHRDKGKFTSTALKR